MNGIGPELPLSRDVRHGPYALITSYKEEARQNFKNLLLTSPGERVMIPSFGVGLYNFLFEMNTELNRAELESTIRAQVRQYMPFVQIREINLGPDSGIDIDENSLGVVIKYAIPSTGDVGILRINT